MFSTQEYESIEIFLFIFLKHQYLTVMMIYPVSLALLGCLVWTVGLGRIVLPTITINLNVLLICGKHLHDRIS
jgi:hypothetical protein